MDKKIVSLIVRIMRLSEAMKSMTKDLDKIAEWLQDPELSALFADCGFQIVTAEDFE